MSIVVEPTPTTKRIAARRSLWNDDRIVVAMIVLFVILTRIPVRTTMLYNWDSANFALATRAFDVTRHYPHPPGYALYVALGWIGTQLLGDANAGLVAVTLLLSACAVPMTFLAGRAIFGRRAGIAAAMLLATSVTFWSYGGIALAYPALALFSAGVGWAAYRAGWQCDRSAWLPLSVLYALGSGFRPDLLAFLGPLWLAGMLRVGRWRFLAGAAVVGALVALWFVPTVLLSGGLDAYLAVLSAYTDRDVLDKYSATRGGLGAFIVNIRDVVSYSWYALYAIVAPLAAGLVLLRPRRDARWLFFALWIGPMLAFYVVIHIGDPGYAFNYLPALTILAAQAIVLGTRRIGRPALATAVVTAVALINAAILFLYPRTLTAPGVRASDAAMAARIGYLRSQTDDGSTLLLSYDSYRHLQYYLPTWSTSLWVDPFAAAPVTTALDPRTRWLLVVDERLETQAGDRPAGEVVPVPAVRLIRYPVQPGQTLTYGAGVLSLNPAR